MAHKASKEINQLLAEAGQQVALGGTYAHYKDSSKHYKVTQFVIIEATDEIGVIYEAQYGDHFAFLRPLSDWLAVVEWKGKKLGRFTLVN